MKFRRCTKSCCAIYEISFTVNLLCPTAKKNLAKNRVLELLKKGTSKNEDFFRECKEAPRGRPEFMGNK